MLNHIRDRHQFDFVGFGDWTIAQVMQHTGLSHDAASLAQQRMGSEPLSWLDAPSKLDTFAAELAKFQLKLVRGGRFYHVMGNADKGIATQKIIKLLHNAYPDHDWVTVALGDGDNDAPMLQAVHIPIIMPEPKSKSKLQQLVPHARIAPAPGPTGWAIAISEILTQFDADKLAVQS